MLFVSLCLHLFAPSSVLTLWAYVRTVTRTDIIAVNCIVVRVRADVDIVIVAIVCVDVRVLCWIIVRAIIFNVFHTVCCAAVGNVVRFYHFCLRPFSTEGDWINVDFYVVVNDGATGVVNDGDKDSICEDVIDSVCEGVNECQRRRLRARVHEGVSPNAVQRRRQRRYGVHDGANVDAYVLLIDIK